MTFSSVDEFTIPQPVRRPEAQGPQLPVSPTNITKVPGVKTGIVGATNQVGAQLGFGGVTPGFVGPTLPTTGVATQAGTLTSTPLSGVAGAAAVGAVGGQLIAGMTGGNETGGSIGGAIGGAAGSYAAGTAAGAAIGSAIGIGAQALNFVLPGLGIIVGGLAGSVFGPDDPNITSEFTSRFGKDGRLTDIQIGSKHIGKEQAQYVATNIDSYFSKIQSLTGLDFADHHIRGGLGGGKEGTGFINLTNSGAKNIDPYRPTTQDVKRIQFDISKPDELNNALNQAAIHLAKVSGASERTLETIRNYKPTQAGVTLGNQPRSKSGVPLVGAKRTRSKTSFEQFAEDYRRKQNNV